jgi:ribose transport system permease protein
MTELTYSDKQTTIWTQIGKFFRSISPIYVVAILLLLAVGYLNPNFVTVDGFLGLLRRAAPLIVLTAGQLFVVVSGGFDLSVGSMVTFVVIGSAIMINNDPSNTWWVILLLLGIGVVAGVINGVVVSILKVPSLIATLGMLLVLRGAGLFWSGGAPRGYLTDNFRNFGRGAIENVPVIGKLPYAVIILIVFGSIVTYILHYTNFGRQLLALGDNAQAAKLSGVSTNRVRILAFIFSSVSAVIAGVLLGGFGGVNIKAGDGLELQSISAAVLGGAVLLGGRGSMPAAMAGALALELLFALLNLLGLPKPIRDAVQGFIIIGAVAYAAYRSNRKQ